MQALRTRPGLRRGGIIYLCTEDIAPCPVQPRKVFDETSLRELSDSIRNYGILNPLTVRSRGGKRPTATCRCAAPPPRGFGTCRAYSST